jgi:hypothetical protein
VAEVIVVPVGVDDVGREHRQRGARPAGPLDLFGQLLVQHPAVEQAGQRIPAGQPLQFRPGRLRLGVLPADGRHLGVVPMRGVAHLERPAAPVYH